MAERIKVPSGSSITVRVKAPRDRVANVVLDDAAGASSSFKVFDADKDEVLSTAEAVGQTTWGVTNAGVFEVGDVVELTQDDGAAHSATITAVDAGAGTIDVDVGNTVAAAAGKRVRARLGSSVSMSEYGAPSISSREWGYQGPLAPTHPGLELRQNVDVAIDFVGAVGGGLDWHKELCLAFAPDSDCSEACA